MRNFRCEWTNEQCFDRWFYGFPQEQQRDHKQTGCGLSESGNWASDLGPASLWPYWGGKVTNHPLKWHSSSEWQSTELCFVLFCSNNHINKHTLIFITLQGLDSVVLLSLVYFRLWHFAIASTSSPFFFVRNRFCVPNWGQLKTHRNPSYIYIDSFDGKVLY